MHRPLLWLALVFSLAAAAAYKAFFVEGSHPVTQTGPRGHLDMDSEASPEPTSRDLDLIFPDPMDGQDWSAENAGRALPSGGKVAIILRGASSLPAGLSPNLSESN